MDLFVNKNLEESFYKKIEKACLGFYNHLKRFDPNNQGLLDRHKFYEILSSMLEGFRWEQIYYIVDFALVKIIIFHERTCPTWKTRNQRSN
jgi:hypothetical protein